MFKTVNDSFVRFAIPEPSAKRDLMQHHKLGLSWTASGYGSKIPTPWMVRTTDSRWRRVYVCQYSNSGSAYVIQGGERILVDLPH